MSLADELTCSECDAHLPDGGPCRFCKQADAAGVVNGGNATVRERRRNLVGGYRGQTPTVSARCGECGSRTRVLATARVEGTSFECGECGRLNVLPPPDKS